MQRMKWKVFLLVLFFSLAVFGAGFQLYTEGSTEALGQGAAIVGRGDLVSQAWYNPSALAGASGMSVMLGGTFVQADTRFESPSGNASMDDEWHFIPHLYYVQPVVEDLTALLSVNSPYGLVTEWPEDWPGAGLAIYTELRTVYFTPSLAWCISDFISVSGGFNIVDAYAKMTQTNSVLKGDDIGYGYTLSTRVQPLEDWALGIRYQSRVDLEFSGRIDGAIPASADLTLPSTVTAGLANTSIRNLSLGLDFVWTEWSTYDRLAVESLAPVPVVPKDWNDVWSIRLGGEYAVAENWALRAGYVWDESPVPDTTRSPELPDSDRRMIMGGIGWKGAAIEIDAAYSYLWAEKARMGTIYSPFVGEFEADAHLISLSASYVF